MGMGACGETETVSRVIETKAESIRSRDLCTYVCLYSKDWLLDRSKSLF